MSKINNENIYSIIEDITKELFLKEKINERLSEVEDKDICLQKIVELNTKLYNNYLYNNNILFTKDEINYIDKLNLYDLINEFTEKISKYVKK